MPRIARRRGVAALEFALILPIWFALVAAIAEFGWYFFHATRLDSAANLGCRDGALVDPGIGDVHLDRMESAATARMVEVLTALGDPECTSCDVEAFTLGAAPRRTLVCVARRDLQPLVGLYLGPQELVSVQVSRLEWQHGGAP